MKLEFVSAVLETTAILYGLPSLSSSRSKGDAAVTAVALSDDLTITFALSFHASTKAKQYENAIQTEPSSGAATPDYPVSSSQALSRMAEGVV